MECSSIWLSECLLSAEKYLDVLLSVSCGTSDTMIMAVACVGMRKCKDAKDATIAGLEDGQFGINVVLAEAI